MRALINILGSVWVASVVSQAAESSAAPEWPGRRADGSILLPNQWSLRPVGHQIALQDFPVNVALHPDGRHAAVLHSGYGKHCVVLVDLETEQPTALEPLNESFYGLEFSRDGRKLYCSGASYEVVHVFDCMRGALTSHQTLPLRDVKERGVPAGLTLNRAATRLWVANVFGQRVTELDLIDTNSVTDIALSSLAPARELAAAPADRDLAAETKRGAALLDPTEPNDPFPYDCLVDERRQRLYVSLWAQAAVAVIDLKTRTASATWKTEEHPCKLALNKSGSLLYVANANRNTVTALDTQSGRALETLSSSLYPNSLPGSTPNSLALSPDEKLLFVANADNNNVAVFDVRERGRSRSLGFIPVGWYPTSVRVTPDGKRLLVANGKGSNSSPNADGRYIGGLFQGTLSVIDLPARASLEKRLKEWSAMAYQCSPLRADGNVVGHRPPDSPIPARPGEPSPIKYCIYVIKENRTYDQVLGDLASGNGDPTICIFPEKVTPNHHQLAREFVLLDNFYVNSEVSADGHEWTVGAHASDFVERMWPLNYGHDRQGKIPYPSEGRFNIAAPAEGYIWDRAREAGVSFRSYGEFINLGKKPTDPATTRVAALQGHFDPSFRPWDLAYPDVKRAGRFLAELQRFEQEGDMPRLQILRLPNDHTSGTSVGKLTPTSMVAENDLALGQLIEGITRSKFWPQTAVFVVEDDAQNGSDHVDAHRTIAFAISPYIRRGSVDSTPYSTAGMLRTMELILGLRPLTQYDAAATAMFRSFQATADVRPYVALPAQVSLTEKNQRAAWGADRSEKMNFAREDAADDLLLNEVIWRSVRGADSPMPAPVRAAFVFPRAADEDDD